MLAFKIANDPHMGSLTFCRIYSGHARSRRACWRTRSRKSASASAACSRCTPTAASRSTKPLPATSSPSSASRTRPRATRSRIRTRRSSSSAWIFPEPVIDIAVEPKSKADQEKMGLALARLAAEDPSFRVKTDEESGQTIISGMGELAPRHHRRPHAARVQGRGQYRCAAGGLPRGDHPHGRARLHPQEAVGWFGPVRPHQVHASSRTKPARASSSSSQVVGGNVPKEYVPGVQKGVESVMGAGPLIGFPIVDVKFTLTDGAYHDVELLGPGLRNRRPCGLPRSHREGGSEDPRADHAG